MRTSWSRIRLRTWLLKLLKYRSRFSSYTLKICSIFTFIRPHQLNHKKAKTTTLSSYNYELGTTTWMSNLITYLFKTIGPKKFWIISIENCFELSTLSKWFRSRSENFLKPTSLLLSQKSFSFLILISIWFSRFLRSLYLWFQYSFIRVQLFYPIEVIHKILNCICTFLQHAMKAFLYCIFHYLFFSK